MPVARPGRQARVLRGVPVRRVTQPQARVSVAAPGQEVRVYGEDAVPEAVAVARGLGGRERVSARREVHVVDALGEEVVSVGLPREGLRVPLHGGVGLLGNGPGAHGPVARVDEPVGDAVQRRGALRALVDRPVVRARRVARVQAPRR